MWRGSSTRPAHWAAAGPDEQHLLTTCCLSTETSPHPDLPSCADDSKVRCTIYVIWTFTRSFLSRLLDRPCVVNVVWRKDTPCLKKNKMLGYFITTGAEIQFENVCDCEFGDNFDRHNFTGLHSNTVEVRWKYQWLVQTEFLWKFGSEGIFLVLFIPDNVAGNRNSIYSFTSIHQRAPTDTIVWPASSLLRQRRFTIDVEDVSMCISQYILSVIT